MRCFTVVCFDCRRAIRDPLRGRVTMPKCAVCRSELKVVSHRLRIPPRAAKDEWERLWKRLVDGKISEVYWRHYQAVRKQHYLEQRILDLQQRPMNSGRSLLIRDIQRKLDSLKSKIAR